jgi:hypothetical protein
VGSSVVSLRVDQPALYQIKLLGRLSAEWSSILDDFAVTASASEDDPTVTTLRGRVADQAALFGLLSRIRDLGLPLLLVEYLAAEPQPSTSPNRKKKLP